MGMEDVAKAMRRVEAVVQRRPQMSIHDDPPATARWMNGLRTVASHSNGMQVLTDMTTELGGTGDQVSPGWLFRAGIASCVATCIAMSAAAAGIELTTLEVRASSRSDVRGLLGLAGDEGKTVTALLGEVQLHVRIGAAGVSPERLRALVESGERCSPVSNTVRQAVALGIHIDVEAA